MLSASTRERASNIRGTIDAFNAGAVCDLSEREIALLQGALDKISQKIEAMLSA